MTNEKGSSLKTANPELYHKIRTSQEKLKADCAGLPLLIRTCPYCGRRIADIAKGSHGYTFAKCTKCGEDVIFGPVMFRLA